MNRISSFALLTTLAVLAGCSSTPPPPAASAPVKPPRPASSASATSAAPTRPATKPIAPTAAAKPTTTPAEPTATPAAAIPQPPPKLTPETEAVIYRFTHPGSGTTAHQLADTTGFPSALASLQSGASAPKIENLGNVNLPPPKGLTADGNSTELVERDWTGLVLVPVNAALSKAYTTQIRLLKVEAHPLHDGRLRIWARIRNLSDRALPAEIACSFRMRGETSTNSPYFYQLQVPSGDYRDVFFVSPDGELSAYTVLVRSEEMWKQK